MDGLCRAERELLDQLPCHVATNYSGAILLIGRGRAKWAPGSRFGCGYLLPVFEGPEDPLNR